MIRNAIPLLHVSKSSAAADFFSRLLGFRIDFAHRFNDAVEDPCYLGISRDGVGLHLSSFSGDGVAGGVANLIVDDVDSLHAEFIAKGVPIKISPVDQTWGTREMYVEDADGNTLRFVQP